ncbi:MAG: hypothetical protein JW852_06585 [Spirochaetales bacterium]|nr:hypothetical protein [Spirochaetales bacterium]
MKDENGKRTVTYTYERHPDYHIVYANGAVGGVTPRGEVLFDLFIEFVGIPDETVHSVTPDGLGPEIGRKPESPPFTRQSQIGVVMNPGQAKSLGYWLINQVENMERKREERVSGGGDKPPVH